VARAEHRAIDGSRVGFDGPVGLAAPFTSSTRLELDGLIRELTSATAASAAQLPVDLTEEYAYAGGTLRIGHRVETDPSIRATRRDTFAMCSV
jgi:hypothetical protein